MVFVISPKAVDTNLIWLSCDRWLASHPLRPLQ